MTRRPLTGPPRRFFVIAAVSAAPCSDSASGCWFFSGRCLPCFGCSPDCGCRSPGFGSCCACHSGSWCCAYRLDAAEWRQPSSPKPTAMTWSESPQPVRRSCRPFGKSSGWSSSRDRIRSSFLHPFPCSPSPTPALPPPPEKRPDPRSLPRCARPVASAYWCKTTYPLVA
jgi:hypothetical protein